MNRIFMEWTGMKDEKDKIKQVEINDKQDKEKQTSMKNKQVKDEKD